MGPPGKGIRMRRDVSRRLIALREAVQELSRPECGQEDTLVTDRTLRAAVERWLQVSIEACIDLAAHEVAARGWTPPEYARDAFLTLAGHGLLPLPLAKSLASAAGLRNLLVHEYVTVDAAQLAATVRLDVKDLSEFAVHAATWRGGTG
ncbi:MAG: hypothetical protein RL653_2383 [Pseudomonadota bacterium]|jgi:uncharacterized protein YutE (UPF0331/DUF86 family)